MKQRANCFRKKANQSQLSLIAFPIKGENLGQKNNSSYFFQSFGEKKSSVNKDIFETHNNIEQINQNFIPLFAPNRDNKDCKAPSQISITSSAEGSHHNLEILLSKQNEYNKQTFDIGYSYEQGKSQNQEQTSFKQSRKGTNHFKSENNILMESPFQRANIHPIIQIQSENTTIFTTDNTINMDNNFRSKKKVNNFYDSKNNNENQDKQDKAQKLLKTQLKQASSKENGVNLNKNSSFEDKVQSRPIDNQEQGLEGNDIYQSISFDEDANLIGYSSNLFDLLSSTEFFLNKCKIQKNPPTELENFKRRNSTLSEHSEKTEQSELAIPTNENVENFPHFIKEFNHLLESPSKLKKQQNKKNNINSSTSQEVQRILDSAFVSLLEMYESSKKREILQIFNKHDLNSGNKFKNQMLGISSCNIPKNNSTPEIKPPTGSSKTIQSQVLDEQGQQQQLLISRTSSYKNQITFCSPALQNFRKIGMQLFQKLDEQQINYLHEDYSFFNNTQQKIEEQKPIIPTLNNVSCELGDQEYIKSNKKVPSFQKINTNRFKALSISRQVQNVVNQGGGANITPPIQQVTSGSIKNDNGVQYEDYNLYFYQFDKVCYQNSLRGIINIILEHEKENSIHQVIYRILKLTYVNNSNQQGNKCFSCEQIGSNGFQSLNSLKSPNRFQSLTQTSFKKIEWQQYQNMNQLNFDNISIDIVVNPKIDLKGSSLNSRSRKEKIRLIFRRDITANFYENVYLIHSVLEEQNRNKAEVLLVKKLFIDSFQSVSHEFGTALNCINNLSDVACQSLPEEAVLQIIKPIRYNSTLIQYLVNDILDHHMILQNTFMLDNSGFSLLQLKNEIIDLFYLQIEYKNLKLSINIDPILPDIVISDRNRIQSILMTMIRNAIKYTKKGNISLDIKLSFLINNQNNMSSSNYQKKNQNGFGNQSNIFILSFEVSDTGVGLDESESSRLRQLLNFGYCNEQISKNSLGNGVGGLCVSNLIAIRLSGLSNKGIQFHKNPNGKGTVFIFQVECSSNQNLKKIFFMNMQTNVSTLIQIDSDKEEGVQEDFPNKIKVADSIQIQKEQQTSKLIDFQKSKEIKDSGFFKQKKRNSLNTLNSKDKQKLNFIQEIKEQDEEEITAPEVIEFNYDQNQQEILNNNDNKIYSYLQHHNLIQQQLLDNQLNISQRQNGLNNSCVSTIHISLALAQNILEQSNNILSSQNASYSHSSQQQQQQLAHQGLMLSQRLECIQDKNYQIESLISNLKFFRTRDNEEADFPSTSPSVISTPQLLQQSYNLTGKKRQFNPPRSHKFNSESYFPLQSQFQPPIQTLIRNKHSSDVEIYNNQSESLMFEGQFLQKMQSLPFSKEDLFTFKQKKENIKQLFGNQENMVPNNLPEIAPQKMLDNFQNENDNLINNEKQYDKQEDEKMSQQCNDSIVDIEHNSFGQRFKNQKEQHFMNRKERVTFGGGESQQLMEEEQSRIKENPQLRSQDLTRHDSTIEGKTDITKAESTDIMVNNKVQNLDQVKDDQSKQQNKNNFHLQLKLNTQIDHKGDKLIDFESPTTTPGFFKEYISFKSSYKLQGEPKQKSQTVLNENEEISDQIMDETYSCQVLIPEEHELPNLVIPQTILTKSKTKLTSSCCIKVLFVDDEPFNHFVMKAIFSQRKIHFDKALDGSEAVQKFIERKKCLCCGTSSYSLILMDLNMPIKNGFEATAEIKKYVEQHYLNDVIVVTCSAFIDLGSKVKAIQNGSDFFLHKPINQQKLFEIIESNFSI